MERLVLFVFALELFFVTLESLFVTLLSFGDLTHDVRQRDQVFAKTNMVCLDLLVILGGLLENRLGLGLTLQNKLHRLFEVHRS